MNSQFRGLVAATLLTAVAPGCIIFKPALADTNERETTAVELRGGKPSTDKNAAEATGIDSLLGYVSSGIQAAIDSDAARYSAVYSGSAVISDFWDKDGKPVHTKLTLKRKTPGVGTETEPADERGVVASTFEVALERVDPSSTKFIVRPTNATIEKAMAKLLTGGIIAVGAWFTDTTTLLNVEVKWKVEDLGVATPTSTEATVSIPGYDMDAFGTDKKHVNYFATAKPEDNKAGVLDFPHADKSAGLYRVTVTVTEKDPFNVDRSVEAEKQLVKDLIDELKKHAGSGST